MIKTKLKKLMHYSLRGKFIFSSKTYNVLTRHTFRIVFISQFSLHFSDVLIQGEISMSEENKNCIVLAEDSPTNRTVIKHLLLKLGFKVIECDTGQVAWEALENEFENENIVAIISDIMMPDMDGIDLLAKVRENEKYKELPFVLVTAVMEKEQVLSAKKLGVNGYILKPVTFQRISTKLKELFPEHKFPRMIA